MSAHASNFQQLQITVSTASNQNNHTLGTTINTYHVNACAYVPTDMCESTNDTQIQFFSTQTSDGYTRTIHAASSKHAPTYNRHQPTSYQEIAHNGFGSDWSFFDIE